MSKFEDFPMWKTELIGDRLGLRIIKVTSNEEEKGSAIILPNGKIKETSFTYSRNPIVAEVRLVGDGSVGDHVTEMPFNIGDIVILDRPAEIDFTKGNLLVTKEEPLFIARKSNVIAVMRMPADMDFEEKQKLYNQIGKEDEKK